MNVPPRLAALFTTKRVLRVALPAVWYVLVQLSVGLTLNVVARILAAASGFIGLYGLALVLNWKTLVWLLVLVVAGLFAVATSRRAEAIGFAGRTWRALLVGIALLVVAWRLVTVFSSDGRGPNRWGFVRTFEPGRYTLDKRASDFPPMDLRINSHSYRDDEWEIPPKDDGTIRVLVVGDSQVFGYGLASNAETIDSQTETRLDAAGTARWDLWNIANPPASIWYYSEAVMRIAEVARPRYAILSIFPFDVTFVDEQKCLADKSPWFYALEYEARLLEELLWMRHNLFFPKNEDPLDVSDGAVAFQREAFERLLAYGERTGLHIVVWEPVMKFPFFDSYRARPGVTFVDWTPPRPLACKQGWTNCTWQDDLSFAYDDGHPLAGTNALFADTLAAALLRLEAARHD